MVNPDYLSKISEASKDVVKDLWYVSLEQQINAIIDDRKISDEDMYIKLNVIATLLTRKIGCLLALVSQALPTKEERENFVTDALKILTPQIVACFDQSRVAIDICESALFGNPKQEMKTDEHP